MRTVNSIVLFLIWLTLLANFIYHCNKHNLQAPEVNLSSEPTKHYILRVKVTGYSSDENQTDSTPDVPAFAKKVSANGCAVSKPLSLLAPAGSLVFIGVPGSRDVEVRVVNDLLNTAEDKSGSILAVDLWMPTREEALKVGSKWQTIVVIPNKKHYK